MPVNEEEDQFALLAASYSTKFSNNEYLGPVDLNNQTNNDNLTIMDNHSETTSTLHNDKGETASKGSEVDQQSTKNLSISPS